MVVFILYWLSKGYVHTRKSDNGGPKRKYYTISESGQEVRTIQREMELS